MIKNSQSIFREWRRQHHKWRLLMEAIQGNQNEASRNYEVEQGASVSGKVLWLEVWLAELRYLKDQGKGKVRKSPAF